MKRKSAFFGLIFSTFLIAGCSREWSDWWSACPLRGITDPVIAQGETLTVRTSEYQAWANVQLSAAPKTADRSQLLRDYVNDLVRQKIVHQWAGESGLYKNPEYAQRENEVLVGMLTAAISVSDAEVRAYYDSHKGEFVSPFVLYTYSVSPSLAAAKKVQAALTAGQAVPGMLSAAIPPEGSGVMDRVVWALSPGGVSAPVKLPHGYEVARRNSDPDYSMVEEQVRQRLKKQKFEAKIAQLTTQAKVVVDQKKVATVKLIR